MGHEGNLGIITEAVLRIRKIPEAKEYSSIVFPDFETGIKFMEEVARKRIWPASIRVVDNAQFQFAMCLKEGGGALSKFLDGFKQFYLTKIKGFDIDKISACTIVYEGTEQEVST